MAARNTTPIYMQVAVDVAGRISKDELKVGQKLSGRSTLASEYNVSPETIRKAMKLLSDVNIVEVKHGNGVHVSSVLRAEEFIERYNIKVTVNELKEELLDLMKQREAIETKMNETMNAIIDYTSRFKNSDHVSVNEYGLGFEHFIDGKTIGDLDLRAQTGVTLVGIRRNSENMLNPDDDTVLYATDKLLYVGGPATSVRLGEYLRSLFDVNNG